jgi:lysophospholipase L1-like esterase
MRRRMGLILATLGALLLALAAAEGLARATGLGPEAPLRMGTARWDWGELIHRRSAIPGLTYELAPSLAGDFLGTLVITNSEGLRGPERLPVKGPGLRRIAVLGDSTTFGWGVPALQAWPARLQTALDQRTQGLVHEVLNFGVSGYSSRDEAVVLEAKALPAEPDLVLVGYNLNDPEFRPRQPLHRFFAPAPWWEGSRLARWAVSRWDAWQQGGSDTFRALHALDSETWASVRHAFVRMAELTEAADIPVLVVLFPLGEVPADPALYRYAALHAQVADAARDAGLHVLDLAPAYSAVAGGPGYLLPDLHPNPRGHEIAAEAVAERLLTGPPRIPGPGD